MNWLIIVAGGNGERFKLKYNKIFAPIKKIPVIYWTISVFDQSIAIDKIVITAREVDIPRIKKIIHKYNFNKITALIPADKIRQASTFKVLTKLKNIIQKDDLVGIHNAVNPFVMQSEIEKVFLEAKKHRAALLSMPAKDTVKHADEQGFIKTTPARNYCWYAQTPQVAFFADLYHAFCKAEKDNFIGTDDTQLLERVGIKAKIVPCSNLNFKITYPEDLLFARKVLPIFQKQNA